MSGRDGNWYKDWQSVGSQKASASGKQATNWLGIKVGNGSEEFKKVQDLSKWKEEDNLRERMALAKVLKWLMPMEYAGGNI